jgi:hypothetical protein
VIGPIIFFDFDFDLVVLVIRLIVDFEVKFCFGQSFGFVVGLFVKV